jgi:hypothetical protein
VSLLGNRVLRVVLFFSLYHLVGWIFHLLLLSITAFFHFQLGHSLRSVDQWVVGHGWYLVMLTKLGGVFTFWFFLRPEGHWRKVRVLAQEWLTIRFHRETVIILLFMAIYAFVVSNPVVNQNSSSYAIALLSYFGITSFYLADLFIYNLLLTRLFLDQRGVLHLPPLWTLLILSFISAATLKVSYGHLHRIDVVLWVNLFFTFYLVGLYHHGGEGGVNWLGIVPYILLIFAPMGALLGVDPLWADRFSAFKLPDVNLKFQFVIMITLSVLYLLFLKYRRVNLGGDSG